MSKQTYRVMEWHRGELQPIMTKDKDGKKVERTVYIDESSAEELNRDFSERRNVGTKIKYVLKEEKKAFNYKTASKPKLIEYCEANGIEFDETEKASELKEKIEKHLK